jgi:hypothetical protein
MISACALNRVTILAAATTALTGCQNFDTSEVLRSDEGVYAIVARNNSGSGTGDATAICLSFDQSYPCSRAKAAVFIYRAADFNVAWRGDQLLIHIRGGEVWKHDAVVTIKGKDHLSKTINIYVTTSE